MVGTGDGIDLLRALGSAYTADHPETNVIVPPSIGSGGGIAAVGSNKEVLARIARPLSDSEKEAGLVATPVFRLPSAFFVHRSAGVTEPDQRAARRHLPRQDHQLEGRRRRRHAHQGGAPRGSGFDPAGAAPVDARLEGPRHHREVEDRRDHAGRHQHREGSGRRDRFRSVHACARRWSLSVLKIDGRYPTDRDYPSAVTLCRSCTRTTTVTPDAKRFIDYAKAAKAQDGPHQHGRRSGRRVMRRGPRIEILPRLSSLSTRLIIAVVATATVAFAASFGLTIVRLDQGLERQAEQLGRLSEEKLGQRLDGEARLAGARRRGAVLYDFGARLESIAQRADVVKAISSANVVAISELLGRAAQAADIDGILVVDTKLRVFGAAQRQGRHRCRRTARCRRARSRRTSCRSWATTTASVRASLRRAVELDDGLAQALGADKPRAAGLRHRRADLRRFRRRVRGAHRASHVASARGRAGGVLPAGRRGRPRGHWQASSISVSGIGATAASVTEAAEFVAAAHHRRPTTGRAARPCSALARLRARAGRRASCVAQRVDPHRRGGRPLARLVADRRRRHLGAAVRRHHAARVAAHQPPAGADHRGGARRSRAATGSPR